MVAFIAPLAKEHQMLRILSVALAVIGFGSFAASAADTGYRDPSGRFSVTVPDGWSGQAVGDPQVALIISAPGSDDYGGLCIVSVKEIAEMRSLSQAQIDEVFTKELNRTFWDAVFQAANAKDVTVEDSGMREQNGHRAYYALASATVTLPTGAVSRMKSKIQMQVIPGSFHAINCRSTAEAFASYSPQFETVLGSHIPLGSGYIASLPQGGSAMLGYGSARPDARATVNAARAMVSDQLRLAQYPHRR